MEHMYKIVIVHKGKHSIVYVYLLINMFHHLNIPVGAGIIRTAKQPFTLNTLVECECIEGKGNSLSKVFQLIMKHDQLKHELEEMIVCVSNKDADCLIKGKSSQCTF